jgi:hypothetical protein
MREQDRPFSWKAIGTLAIFLGMFGALESPAWAIPVKNQNSFELAQVGVRSRLDGPTPLNLRPRTDIPLPRSSYYGYPRSRNYHRDEYKYGHEHYHTHHRRRDSHRRGPVIIINPNNYFEYSNYDSYIRVIRK